MATEPFWPGVDTEREARLVFQEICRVIQRPKYTVHFERDEQQLLREMATSIILHIQAITRAPTHGLAKVLGVHASRVSEMKKGKLPLKDPLVFNAFRRAVIWMIRGSGGKRPGRFGATTPAEQEIIRSVAENIVRYFFPEDQYTQNAVPPYFRLPRRLSPAPYDKDELAKVLRWMKDSVKLDTPWGFVLFVIPDDATGTAIFSGGVDEAISDAGQASNSLAIVILHPRQQPLQATQRIIANAGRISNVQFLPIGVPIDPSQNIFNPLAAYAYLAFPVDTTETRKRFLIIRPLADEATMPFTLEGSRREEKRFREAFNKIPFTQSEIASIPLARKAGFWQS